MRVLIADDHAVVADGLVAYLRDTCDVLEVVSDGQSLIDAAVRLSPDVIITDISMPQVDGLEALRALSRRGVISKVIVLTMHDEPEFVQAAFEEGASAYLLKNCDGRELINAMTEVMRGRVYITSLIAKSLVSALKEAKSEYCEHSDKLTRRQRDILRLIADGKTMKEAAALLGISTRTAESYKYKAMEQLGVQTTAELIQHAVRAGIVSNTKRVGHVPNRFGHEVKIR
jgi:DNA-binding NarL/FixJ family response regulator